MVSAVWKPKCQRTPHSKYVPRHPPSLLLTTLVLRLSLTHSLSAHPGGNKLAMACTNGRSFWMYGGLYGEQQIVTTQFWRFDLDTKMWTLVSNPSVVPYVFSYFLFLILLLSSLQVTSLTFSSKSSFFQCVSVIRKYQFLCITRRTSSRESVLPAWRCLFI